MIDFIASRKMFIRNEETFTPITISITKPTQGDGDLYSCFVSFTGVEKYNAKLQRLDEINAIECAIRYIDSICANSDDPKFHWDEIGSRHKGAPR